eukprot:gnl/TRDRNA2_/TRDRNA2_164098_c0_seq6.p1 gnl/TRDRNA2_/TRDRNA2_164098_c0~~gnl/TRDRNA2_/TRDRNA2_164098_c0_seq6.p1  ORF type:complete len:287 (-),score=1.28 gnl/TRDRNA2_/TRDRNA2_164098_c0_seq6:393-1253(-)
MSVFMVARFGVLSFAAVIWAGSSLRLERTIWRNESEVTTSHRRLPSQLGMCHAPLIHPNDTSCDSAPMVSEKRYTKEVNASQSVHFFWSNGDSQQVGRVRHQWTNCVLGSRQAFVPGDGAYPRSWPGFFTFVNGHALREPPADNTWVEVIHFQREEDHKKASKRRDAALQGQFWYYLAPGSGIWLNIGRAQRAVRTWTHKSCDDAVRGNYDTIVLYPKNSGLPDTKTYWGGLTEIVDCTASQRDPKSAHAPWTSSCPPPHASQLFLGKSKCACNNSLPYLNCCNST